MFEFQSVRDVIQFAISLEQVSQQFYVELAETVTDPGVHQFLLDMSLEEAMHEQQLRALLDGGEAMTEPIDSGEVQSYVQAMRIPDELDYKKAVKVAYDKEKASQMLYLILSNSVKAGHIKRLLLLLSKQEQRHKEFFAKEYDRVCLSEN